MRNLYQKEWYTPMEIAKRGLIKNSRGDQGTIDSHYNYILELIKSGQLQAKNYSTGKVRSNYLVSEEAIKKYHKA